jgi:hypothetical protein
MRKHYFFSSLVIFMAGFALSAIIDGRRLASMPQGTLSNAVAPGVAAQISRQPYTIQTWEYRVVMTSHLRNDQGGLDSELNRLGRLGFEICKMVKNSNQVGDFIIVLKRPV